MAPETDQSLANLRLERDAIILYDALARIEKDPQRAAAFERIAGNERRHAAVWADKLRGRGLVGASGTSTPASRSFDAQTSAWRRSLPAIRRNAPARWASFSIVARAS